MTCKKITAALFSVLLGAALVGCDEKLAEKKEVDIKSDGKVVEKKETVTEKADGSIEHTKSKEVTDPDDGKKEVDIKVDKKD